MAQRSITAFFKPDSSTTCPNADIASKRLIKSNVAKRLKIDESAKNLDGNPNSVYDDTVENPKKTETEMSSPTKNATNVESTDFNDSNNIKRDVKKVMGNVEDTERSGADYNPTEPKYHPVKHAYWNGNKSTPYLALARTFEIIEGTRGRYKMIEVLSNFFSSIILLNPDDLLPSICLSINQLAPAYEGLELGVAETTLMKIIATTTGRELKFIKSQTQETGDLGIVAERSRISQRMMFRPASLTIEAIYQKLRTIAKTSGKAKIPIIHDIFVACRYSEARFIIRSLIGKMRIGIAEQCLFQALATALIKVENFKQNKIGVDIQNDAALKKKIDIATITLKTAYSQCSSFHKIIPTLLEHGLEKLVELCPMKPGVPLKPMLAQPTRNVSEVVDRLKGNITCEWKYDGERAQIHCNSSVVSIFSRNQENNTTKYPDIISRIDNFKKNCVTDFIVDSEIVAWDVNQKQILPFQILSTRKRKNVDETDIKVQVCIYAFDILYLNGKSLVGEIFAERRRLLRENFIEVEGKFQFATSCDSNDADEIQSFLDESIKGNCEGLMVKSLNTDATYEIAKRSHNWLKLKKDYLSGAGDSLDLVVIGGYKGKGKRTGVYGGFLLACYDDENEEYQSICKIGTGLSEDALRTHANFFKENIINTPKSYYSCDSTLEPDDWFEPVQVWEIKCADLSLSPVHKAAFGLIECDKGISLRFPRFIRIRDDKSAEDATSAQQVAYMYRSQDQIKNQKSNQTDVENDFY